MGDSVLIIAGLFAGTFVRMPEPHKGAMASMVGISIYTVLVGTNAAVVRSAIMGGLSIFARQVGRPQHGLNTLAAQLVTLLVRLIHFNLSQALARRLHRSA